MQSKIKKIKLQGKRHFENNFIIYFILFVFLIVGIIFGSILINRLDLFENHRILGYLCPLMDYINHEDLLYIDIFKINLLSNFKFTLIIWLLGLTLVGMIIIPIMVGLKGITIGFTVGFLVKKFGVKGFTFALFGLLPYYLILLPGMIAICSISLSNANSNNIKGKGNGLRRINKISFVDYCLLFIFFLIIIIIGSLVESFIIPYFIKLTKLNL